MPQCVDVIVRKRDQSDFSPPLWIFSAMSSWLNAFDGGGQVWNQAIVVQERKELSEEVLVDIWSKMCWFCEIFEMSQLAKIDANCDTLGVSRFMLISALRCASFGTSKRPLFERLRGWKKVVNIRPTSKTQKFWSAQKSHLTLFLDATLFHDSKDPQCCAIWSHFGFYFWGQSFCTPQKSHLRIHPPSVTWIVSIPPPQVQHIKTNLPTKWNPNRTCSKSKKVKNVKTPTIFFLKLLQKNKKKVEQIFFCSFFPLFCSWLFFDQ